MTDRRNTRTTGERRTRFFSYVYSFSLLLKSTKWRKKSVPTFSSPPVRPPSARAYRAATSHVPLPCLHLRSASRNRALFSKTLIHPHATVATVVSPKPAPSAPPLPFSLRRHTVLPIVLHHRDGERAPPWTQWRAGVRASPPERDSPSMLSPNPRTYGEFAWPLTRDLSTSSSVTAQVRATPHALSQSPREISPISD
jgi:hypothetical protein